jgi:hypothetical protein
VLKRKFVCVQLENRIGLDPIRELGWLSAYIRLLHLLGFLLCDLTEPLALRTDDLAVSITDHLFVILKVKKDISQFCSLILFKRKKT